MSKNTQEQTNNNFERLIEKMSKVEQEKKRERRKRLQQRTHKKWGENMKLMAIKMINKILRVILRWNRWIKKSLRI